MIYQDIWNKIKEYDVITIYGHVNPDGDCYGSQLGMRNAILAEFPEKRVYALGSGFPRLLDLVGKMDEVDDEIVKSSLALVLDVANQDRVEDQRFRTAKEIIKIDHHIPQEHFGVIELVETERISCTEILTKLLLENNVKLTKEAALPLFLGLVTDSGRFLYQPINQDTFNMAGALASTGIDCGELYDKLYESEEKMLRVKGYIYSNYVKTDEGLIYLCLPKEDLHKLGIDYNTGASQVNSLSNIKGYPVWVFFSESDNGEVRVEFRSKDLDVQQIASQFGGGGHLHASGCRLSSLDEHKYVVEAINKALKESK
jgi:phosphoesterase RecJ-like protein